MDSDLEIFNYFVDDMLCSDINLLRNELDILLMQNLFNSEELEKFIDNDTEEDIFVA